MSNQSWLEILTKKIEDRSARVGVVGLGYVGLPLAVEFAKAGFHVTGIDLVQGKVDQINAGVSYIQDIPSEDAPKRRAVTLRKCQPEYMLSE